MRVRGAGGVRPGDVGVVFTAGGPLHKVARMDAVQILEEVFPVGSGLVRLELVEIREHAGGGLMMTVRLVVCERDGEAVAIRDIKEQEVYTLAAADREDPRLAAAVAGWALAVQHVFEQANAEIESSMPHDFVVIGALLRLRRPQTAEDFCDAALAGKRRLGQFLRA